jgi:RISC-loading complex subunit TARBP2
MKPKVKAVPNPGSNPVGALQELCLSRKISLPVYKVSEEIGVSPDQEFVMMCSLLDNNLVASGKGKSKKSAKHQAATEMLKFLQKDEMKGILLEK